MTIWYNKKTGEQITYNSIKKRHPNISFPYNEPSDLSHLGYLPLELISAPTPLTPQEEVIEGPPEEYSPGRVRQTWTIQIKPEPSVEMINNVLYRAAKKININWDII
jgi:hypothetical protein